MSMFFSFFQKSLRQQQPLSPQERWEGYLKLYMYEVKHDEDYIADLMTRTLIFKEGNRPYLSAIPNFPRPHMHFKVLAPLLLLHKLRVRVSL